MTAASSTCGMRLEPLLDLDRVHVLAAAQDEVALARREVEATTVHPSDVAGAQPVSGREHLGGGLGPTPVARHHHRTPDADLALFAIGQGDAGRVADLELDGRQRPAGGVGERAQLVAGVERRERGALGLAVAEAERRRRPHGSASRVSRCRSRENGDPPPPRVRRLVRSWSARPGWFTKRCSSAVVKPQPVMCSRSMSSHTTSGSNRPTVHTDFTPLTASAMAAVCRPDTWKSGLVTSWHADGASSGGGLSISMRRPWKKLSAEERADVAMAC